MFVGKETAKKSLLTAFQAHGKHEVTPAFASVFYAAMHKPMYDLQAGSDFDGICELLLTLAAEG